MKKHFIFTSCLMVMSLLWAESSVAKALRQTDDQIRQLIIEDSIASYPGVCACPFNSARNGSNCGKRSAWSKPGGYSPLCYKKDVSREMVEEWRKSHGD